MKMHFLIGLSSAALLSTACFGALRAQTGSAPPPAQSEQKANSTAQPADAGPADNQIANEVDARIAQLKASLQLTSDQEKNWPGLQSALHDFGVAQFRNRINDGMRRHGRRDREALDQANDHPNDIALMRKEADELTTRAASLKTLANATEPLYGVLDDRQKQKLMQFVGRAFEGGRR